MTRVLLLLNERAVLILDDPLSPQVLAEQGRTGSWRPPEPFDAWLPAGLPLALVDEGQWVVMLPRAEGSPFPLKGRPALNPSQQQVLRGVLEGLTVRQMSKQLGLHPRTVGRIVSRVKVLLGARSRLEMAVRAVQLGLTLEEGAQKHSP
jgi:DNA-binding CsgD family transcriptional regulator